MLRYLLRFVQIFHAQISFRSPITIRIALSHIPAYESKDDHSKNISFLYDETKKGYVLSPAYDITKTPNKYEHEMTVNGSGNPTKKDLFEIQKAFGLSLKKCEELYNNIIERI